MRLHIRMKTHCNQITRGYIIIIEKNIFHQNFVKRIRERGKITIPRSDGDVTIDTPYILLSLLTAGNVYIRTNPACENGLITDNGATSTAAFA